MFSSAKDYFTLIATIIFSQGRVFISFSKGYATPA
jgi:hypothetical protein